MASPILVVDDNQELLKVLTQLFETAGYSVLAAARGKQAADLALVNPPAVAILDILLPDMTGYTLADVLRRQLPGLPLIFITGVFKAGKHALEARQKYSVHGYFEKPFDSQKLLDTVAKILPPPSPVQAVNGDLFEVELDVDYQEEIPLTEALKLTGPIKLTDRLRRKTEVAGADLTARPITAAELGPVRSPARRSTHSLVSPRGASLEQRSGDLKDNLPSLITAFYIAQETGELGVQRGKAKKVIYFEKGQPVHARSNLISDRFGQFLVRVGKIKVPDLESALAASQRQKKRIAEVLVEQGFLQPTERPYLLGQQIKAIIYSLFAWEEGTYVLNRSGRAAAEPIKLDVHPATLIRRGIKKLYKPQRLHSLLKAQDRLVPSMQPAYQLHEIELDEWEARLLTKVNGTRDVTELVALSGRPQLDVYAFLHSLVALTLLEKIN